MSDSRSVIRLYSKDLNVPAGGVVDVEFKDSDGNDIDCNYISLLGLESALTVGYGYVVLSSLAENSVLVQVTNTTSNGSLGFAARADSFGEISLSDADRVNGCSIYASTAGTLDCVLCYGQIQHASPQRDNYRESGE